jgi:DNA-binding NtrC family response regulator
VLNAAADWQRLEDDSALLHRIAGTATELLNCERASIFLWDRRRKKLIGRPALGVQRDSLEVDDSAGVVGEVLRSGEPKIWNGGSDDAARVNRKVDRSLEFETRSLVAVPMSGQRDELIGVFEAVNHQGDGFDASDAEVLADLATHAAVAIQAQRTRKHLTETRDRLVEDAAATTHLIGTDSKIEAVRRTAAKVAKTDLTVMVLGKNGTGKEVLARHIHFESQRRNGPFIAVNCAALVESLLESELFGHEKGAFTDAHATRVGKFELANGGTLFLDEVGDMSPGGQAKLLRVLEEKVVVRVGGSTPIPVDVRVIAATNQPLEELIRQRRFREDLFFRLNVVNLTLPPLAERGDDVLVLADHFLQQFCYQIGRPIPQLLPSARQALKAHGWPGNVRELRNTIERVCYLCGEDKIGAEDLMLTASGVSPPGTRGQFTGTLGDATRDFQVEYIQRAIDACQGNMTDAAANLGLHRSNLYRKMRQLGMPTSGE